MFLLYENVNSEFWDDYWYYYHKAKISVFLLVILNKDHGSLFINFAQLDDGRLNQIP